MSVKYHIVKSKLLGKNLNVGHVIVNTSFTREMVIDRMLAMGSSITRADILGVLTNYETAIKNICLEGNKVNLEGFMQFTPTISGVFASETSSFDKSVNDIYITAQISTIYNKDFAQKATVEKITTDVKSPILLEVVNIADKTVNTNVTVNGIVSLSGEYLKFDSSVTDEYLRFVNLNNAAEFTAVTHIQKLTDKEIVFLFPETTIVEGYFEVASRHGTGTLRTGRTIFTVAVQ